jgi:hypothetical protein
MFMSDLAMKNNIPPVVTFDQPLFWKAHKIRLQYPALQNVCILLGNFHTVMNLLGSLGTMMECSGLREVLQEVYAENPVTHIMMTGKAYSQAVRGHLMVDAALTSLMIKECFSLDGNKVSGELFSELSPILTDVITGVIKTTDLSACAEIKEAREIFEDKKSQLMLASRTSKLWLEYQNVIGTVRKLISADRLGSLPMLLEGIAEALPIFAATGHTNYTKAAYLHLQNMIELQSSHPDVHAMFQSGRHVVRHSNRNWGGIPADLFIEQALMRTLKTTGGLTRGSGFSETQRSTWLLSMPICSEFNHAMQSLTKVAYESSEQHKDLSRSRVARDNADTERIMQRLSSISPFNEYQSLRNIVTGVTAATDVNVDNIRSIGISLVDKMTGHDIFTYVQKRKDKVQ